jgi:peroxiredoxin
MRDDPMRLPPDLPVPTDDGACIHLRWSALPALDLPSTSARAAALRELGPTVLFFYPRTGIPGQPPSLGFHGEEWDSIPGARGCTPQSCGFRDRYAEFRSLGVEVLGVSTNTTAHQREFKARSHVPFEFLSDSELRLTRTLDLPTFQFPVESGGPDTLLKRMAWYIEPDGASVPRIVKVWYPVFPPDQNAATVLAWLRRRAAITVRSIDASDADYLSQEMSRHWGGTQIWSRGRAFKADALPGLVAIVDGQRVGQVTYSIDPGGYQCEIVTLSATRESVGVGSRLLEAAVNAARAEECIRAFLTTTNDNTRAIGFYQREGWRLAALHKGNVDEARKRVPFIPKIGPSGIPIRDEVELELWLEDGPVRG